MNEVVMNLGSTILWLDVCVERADVWMWMIKKWGTVLTVTESGQVVYGSFICHLSFSVSLKLFQNKIIKNNLYSNHFYFTFWNFTVQIFKHTSWKINKHDYWHFFICFLSAYLCRYINIFFSKPFESK